jgi:hypothetical protein
MTLEFLSRIRKELTITAKALQEITLAISERVNRKTQILRLHWQAASTAHRLEAIYQDLGRRLSDVLNRRTHRDDRPVPPPPEVDEVKRALEVSARQAQHLKHLLGRLDSQIRELKLEAAHEDMIRIQQDLALRSAMIQRVTVAGESLLAGRSVREFELPPSVRVAAILRGPFLLPVTETLTVRTDDVVILLGPQDDLAEILPRFLGRRSVKIA